MLKKRWPESLPWPEPYRNGEGEYWDFEMAEMSELDEDARELLDIKEYYDGLVESGRLNDDYSLNEYYEDWSDDEDQEEDEEDKFVPETGEEYWDEGRFLVDYLEEDLSEHMNLLKIRTMCADRDPVIAFREAAGYDFINENLLRQAFTTRAFAVEYGLSGSNEELEFLGDSILNYAVTKEIIRQLAEVDINEPEAPFVIGTNRKRKSEQEANSKIDEGALSKIRERFVCRDYLSERADKLDLQKYILYGSNEELTDGKKENLIEALVGAVAMDCDWKQDVIAGVIDRLLCIQVTKPNSVLNKNFFDLFNAWHQKHFHALPSYEVDGHGPFYCTLRYYVPENDKDIRRSQRIDVKAESRSGARELAAHDAYMFLLEKGLWKNLKEAKLVPNMDNSINQLQELYQRKYVEERPVYEFEDQGEFGWDCKCTCDGIYGYGAANNKTKAKKKASYMVLVRLLDSAGICEPEWKDRMHQSIMED